MSVTSVSCFRAFVISSSCLAGLLAAGCGQGARRPAQMRFEVGQLPAVPLGVGGAFSGVVDDTLVVAGGTYFAEPPPMPKLWENGIIILRPGAGAWSLAGGLERPLGYGAAISTSKGIMLAGGCDAQRHYDSVRLLTLDKKRWAKLDALPPLPTPAAYLGGTRLGNVLYVAGGRLEPQSQEALRTFWSFDIDRPEDGWRELVPWPGPGRILPVVVAQDGAVYVLSGAELVPGADGGPIRRYLTDGYRYRPGEAWARIPDLPHAVVAAPAVAYGATQVLVFGGDDGSLAQHGASLGNAHPGFRRALLAYDTVTQRWTHLQGLPALPVTTGASWWGGKIVVPTGEDRPRHRTQNVYTVQVTATSRN